MPHRRLGPESYFWMSKTGFTHSSLTKNGIYSFICVLNFRFISPVICSATSFTALPRVRINPRFLAVGYGRDATKPRIVSSISVSEWSLVCLLVPSWHPASPKRRSAYADDACIDRYARATSTNSIAKYSFRLLKSRAELFSILSPQVQGFIRVRLTVFVKLA